MKLIFRARKMMTKELKTNINKQFGMEEIMDAIQEYKGNMTKGKCMLVMDKEAIEKERESGLYEN